MSSFVLIVILLSLSLFFSNFVNCTVFYSDPVNGNNSNSGTSKDQAFGSLLSIIDSGLIKTMQPDNYPYVENCTMVEKNSNGPIQAGDTLKLLSGNHGESVSISMYYNEDYVTIEAEDGEIPYLGKLFCRACWRFVFRGLTVSPELVGVDPAKGTLVSLESHGFQGPSRYCSIEDSYLYTVEDVSDWSLSNWNERPYSCISLTGSYLNAKNNYCKNVNFGIQASKGCCHRVEGNTVENFAGDGLRGLGDNSVFYRNTIKNCYDVNENHDDCFQSWSIGDDGKVGSGTVYNVTVQENVFINYEDIDQPFSGAVQGVGCFDGMFEGWKVIGNLIVINHYHGISLYGAVNNTVEYNTVVDLYPNDSMHPWISMHAHKDGTPAANNTLIGNIANSFPGSKILNKKVSVSQYDKYFINYGDVHNKFRIKNIVHNITY